MLNNTDKINEVISKLKMVEATSENLDLPTLIDGVTITWVSARPTILSNTGVINRGAKDTNVSILATFTYEGTSVQNRYTVKVLGYTVEEKLNMVFSTISFPNLINIDLVLPNSYQYGVVASYSSSNTDILSNDGKEKLGEKSPRCYSCYELRLKDTYEYAKANGYDLYTTTLSISPYKNSDWINEIGNRYSDEKCQFLYSNYKKEQGYLHSIESVSYTHQTLPTTSRV